jgi:hypothetical protein
MIKLIHKKDVSGIEYRQQQLSSDRMHGMHNVCVKCKAKGTFGSIIKHKGESGNIYQICGHCEHVELIQIA